MARTGLDREAAAATERDALREQIKALTAEVARLQRRVTSFVEHGRVVEGAASDYPWFVENFQRRLAEILPETARALVASRGDAALLDIPKRRADHFPQDDASQYAGCYPADDTAAIAHLEALRQDGYDALVFPEPASWWLDHYEGLRRHLETHYVETVSDTLCRVFDLRQRTERSPLDRGRLEQVFEEARQRLGRDPDALDWATGANLRQRFPGFAIAESRAATLPHVDDSIDIVVIADAEAATMREARRVAASAVVVLSEELGVETEWLTDAPAAIPAGRVTVMHLAEPSCTAVGLTDDLRIHLPSGPDEDVLVWVTDGVRPLPGAAAALVDTLRRFPQAGAVGGRILDVAGRMYHAGGALGVDATPRHLGEGTWRTDDPRYAYVRPVDFCSSLFMATTRRAIDAAGGFDTAFPRGAWRDADLCLRLQDRGFAVYYQPEAVAACSGALTRTLRAAASRDDHRRWRRELAARWRDALQSRQPHVETWER